MIIIGAGMAGLIAANYFRKLDPIVYEKQEKLSNNHNAILRFRSDKISNVVGISFKKILVKKAIICNNIYVDKPNIYICNQYALKVSGQLSNRSIWNIDDSIRYVAPFDFINKLSTGITIQLGIDVDKRTLDRNSPIISTIPMPILMNIVNWKHKPKFNFKSIWTITASFENIKSDIYQTIYYPQPNDPRYRASIMDQKLIIEFINMPKDLEPWKLVHKTLDDFGIDLSRIGVVALDKPEVREQKFGKIVPIDEEIRQEFIYTMTREYGIYSLGRFATWRQILLDDVVHDLTVIEKLINAELKMINYLQNLQKTKH